MKYKTFAISLALALAGASAANAQTLTNSDFSSWTGGLPTGWATLLTPSQEAADNLVPYNLAGTIALAYMNAGGGSTFPNAAGFTCAAFCTDSGHDGYQQTVSGLVIGHSYSISYWTNGLHNDGFSYQNQPVAWNVIFGGVTQQGNFAATAYQDNSPQGPQYGNTHYQPWVQTTLTFVASATSQVLAFASQLQPQGQPTVAVIGLANVSISDVTPVPEPSSWVLMLAGVGGFVLLGKRKRTR